MLFMFGGLTTANNTSIGTKQVGTALMTTASKMGNTAILSSSKTGSIPTVKPVGLNSVPTIAPISSKGSVIPAKNSSLAATPSYNPNNAITIEVNNFMAKLEAPTNKSNNTLLLPYVEGSVYPRINPNYAPLSTIETGILPPIKNSISPNTPVSSTTIKPQRIINKKLELIHSDGITYNIVGIYNTGSSKVLSGSSADKGIGTGKILFPTELTSSANTHGAANKSYNNNILTSIIDRDIMISFLVLNPKNTWKPFLFERTETTVGGKVITHLYSNIEKLIIHGVYPLHYLPTPTIN